MTISSLMGLKSRQSTETVSRVYNPGDLVRVNSLGMKHFHGMLALVVSNMGQDITDHSNGWYYRISFDNGVQHIFYHRELDLVSKAERNNNENR